MPFFFIPDLDGTSITLNEDTSKHVIGVLRMQKRSQMLLTDGKGKKAVGIIEDDNRKKCRVRIESVTVEENKNPKTAVGISLIKNTARFEWFLEKATEIGVSEIIPLLCERTEKQKFRTERMQAILVSAMIQSQQLWLPLLHEPTLYHDVLKLEYKFKFIAHCMEGEKKPLQQNSSADKIILIGPEGDFTPKEVQAATDHHFAPVSLGNTRLRTETAGLYAAVLLCNSENRL